MSIKKKYWSATPLKWKKLGDACLAVALYGEIHSNTIDPILGSILVYTGVAGKFLTNLFSEDDTQDKR